MQKFSINKNGRWKNPFCIIALPSSIRTKKSCWISSRYFPTNQPPPRQPVGNSSPQKIPSNQRISPAENPRSRSVCAGRTARNSNVQRCNFVRHLPTNVFCGQMKIKQPTSWQRVSLNPITS